MPVQVLENEDQYVLNHCTKFLARVNTDPRHNFGQFSDEDGRSRICEPWCFPIIDSYSGGKDPDKSYTFNKVTFVYCHQEPNPSKQVSVISTFASLYKPLPLKPVLFIGEETGYYALTIIVPKGEIHTYKFIVDGQVILDPINPQRVILENGQFWSRIFTNLCTEPLCFEQWSF